MRDYLCDEKKLYNKIRSNESTIQKKKAKIQEINYDIEQGIQKYPNNKKIINLAALNIFRLSNELIRAKYSKDCKCEELYEDLMTEIDALELIDESDVGYISLLWMVSLGILLEIDDEEMRRIAEIIRKRNICDALIDFLLSSYDIGWNHSTDRYREVNPYSKTGEIIYLVIANNDKLSAGKRLVEYMNNEWFEGHSSYGWKNAHNEHGYVGFWSFETAAIAKLLELDDESLKDNNYYPYDLAHYKDNIKLKAITEQNNVDVIDEKIENELQQIDNSIVIEVKEHKPKKIRKFIDKFNLKNIVPDEFIADIQDLIEDYNTLSNIQFWELHNMERIWPNVFDYEDDNNRKSQIEFIVINELVETGFILRLDENEELMDNISKINNFWNDKNVRIVSFDIDTPEKYYAVYPANNVPESLYSINIV